MPRPRRIALLLLTGFTLVAAGCGQGDKGRITSRQATKLEASVDRVEALIEERQCGAARTAAQGGAQDAQDLKGKVSTKLRNNLIQGFNHLDARIQAECDKPKPEPTATETTTAEPTETATTTSTPSPTPSPTETPSPSPSPTVTVAPTETPDTGTGGTGTDDDSGGSSTP